MHAVERARLRFDITCDLARVFWKLLGDSREKSVACPASTPFSPDSSVHTHKWARAPATFDKASLYFEEFKIRTYLAQHDSAIRRCQRESNVPRLDFRLRCEALSVVNVRFHPGPRFHLRQRRKTSQINSNSDHVVAGRREPSPNPCAIYLVQLHVLILFV